MRACLAPLRDALSRGEAAMLVHVVELKGSGPREVGAQMLVTESGLAGTIGGGELEHSATLKARELMAVGVAAISRLALGPELGQCCGGSVTIAFEPFAPADLAWVEKLIRAAEQPIPVFRTVRIEEKGAVRRDWEVEGEGGEPAFTATLTSGQVTVRELINEPRPALWLFGAGHVGRAVANAVHPLGFALTWVDGRAGQFPPEVPADVRTLSLAMPELIVDEAPAGAIFLVMTHSHPLDEAVCEAVLRREDFAYLGLIGSKTKRARFVSRLGERDVAPALLERLTCPIGLTQIRSKDPAAIAASVAADLLIRRELRHTEQAARTRHAV